VEELLVMPPELEDACAVAKLYNFQVSRSYKDSSYYLFLLLFGVNIICISIHNFSEEEWQMNMFLHGNFLDSQDIYAYLVKKGALCNRLIELFRELGL
jgi:hypothetical protein